MVARLLPWVEVRDRIEDEEYALSVKELGHLVLYVRSVERSAAFYRDVLGWESVLPDSLGVPAAAFSSGRTHHELLLIEVGEGAAELPRGRHLGLYHFGLKVGDSDEELHEIELYIDVPGVDWRSDPGLIMAPIKPLAL